MKARKPKLAFILLSIAAAPMNVLVESTPGLIESTAADSSRIVGGVTARADDYPYFGKQEILDRVVSRCAILYTLYQSNPTHLNCFVFRPRTTTVPS